MVTQNVVTLQSGRQRLHEFALHSDGVFEHLAETLVALTFFLRHKVRVPRAVEALFRCAEDRGVPVWLLEAHEVLHKLEVDELVRLHRCADFAVVDLLNCFFLDSLFWNGHCSLVHLDNFAS